MTNVNHNTLLPALYHVKNIHRIVMLQIEQWEKKIDSNMETLPVHFFD